jgi:hypothetical protein
MPYPNCRGDRAWELFVALVAATKSAAANGPGADKGIGRIPGPFFLESLAREAYIAADAFEKVSRETSPKEHSRAEGNADSSLNLQALAQGSEISPHTEATQEMVDAFKKAEQATVGEN